MPLSAAKLSLDELENALTVALAKIDSNIEKFGSGFPAPTSVKGKYPVTENVQWTSAFWPGQLWLAYETTGREHYLTAANSYLESFDTRIRQGIDVSHHDIGFLYSLSTVPAWILTGNKTARQTALFAADKLCERYRPEGRYIQAWGEMHDPENARLIIDCLMNLPLLYWASDETGNRHYSKIAEAHLRTTLDCIIRPDGSTWHTFFFDPKTGKRLTGVTHQGFNDHSCWSRGQSWAIYGIPLSRRYVHDDSLMSVHQRATDYMLERLPKDEVCYWDLIFTAGDEPRDSSAAAITVCGLLESLPFVSDDFLRNRYELTAHSILRSLAAKYAAPPGEDGLLSHAVYSKPHGNGVDECCVWGDYYYLEAICRLRKNLPQPI